MNETYSLGLVTKKRPQLTAPHAFVKFVRLSFNYLTACGDVPCFECNTRLRSWYYQFRAYLNFTRREESKQSVDQGMGNPCYVPDIPCV